jgi:hypothetical protein
MSHDETTIEEDPEAVRQIADRIHDAIDPETDSLPDVIAALLDMAPQVH